MNTVVGKRTVAIGLPNEGAIGAAGDIRIVGHRLVVHQRAGMSRKEGPRLGRAPVALAHQHADVAGIGRGRRLTRWLMGANDDGNGALPTGIRDPRIPTFKPRST